MELLLEPLRAVTSQIDRILNVFYRLAANIFAFTNSGYLNILVQTIMNNEYLLISLSLVIIGFVIGIIKRLISL